MNAEAYNNSQTNFFKSNKMPRSKTASRSERQYSYECKTNFDDNKCCGIMDKLIQAHLKRFENDIMLNELNFIFGMLSKTGDKRKSGIFVDRNTIDTMQKKIYQVEKKRSIDQVHHIKHLQLIDILFKWLLIWDMEKNMLLSVWKEMS